MRIPTICFLFLLISLSKSLHIGSCLGLICGRNGHCHAGPVNGTQTSYWCRCDEGFGGEYCEQQCDVSKCGADEKCVFDKDYRMETCVCKDCDINGNSLLKPSCPSGYGGDDCKTQGWCYPSVCMNGGQCIGAGNRAKCACPDGFKGERCELDVNECEENKNACGNRSTCMNTLGTYICVCPQGFLPPDCLKPGNTSTVEFKQPVCFLEISADHPDGRSMYCQNGGFCDKASSKCQCPPGYHGSTCELLEKEDSCASNPCSHGVCISFSGGFQCICDDGYSGSYCQEGKDNCVNNKCEAGSKCINGVNSYFCDCPPERTGPYCEKMDCSAIPDICNHGTCIDSPLSEKAFECQCEPGYEGILCEQDKNECLSENMCLNNGTCVNLPGSFRCDCARGFGGKWCDEPLNMCQDFHCENDGTCMHTSDHSPVCQCKNGFIGKRCEKECPIGFGGVRCDLRLEIGICSRQGGKCFNGGKCLSGFCVCPPDFTGNQCEVNRKNGKSSLSENLCLSDPCMNNATCIDVDAHIGYACICKQGFEGDICERHKDLCLENPCSNGGVCHQHRESFSCDCPPGFYGNGCEQEKMFRCLKSTCQNGGVCINEEEKGRKCECSYGFSGARCEEKINLTGFTEKDSLLRSVCEKRKCSERANDGNCDADCNYAACKFDGGDCSGKREPFSKCRYGNMCADFFANGVCNQACNNEECLYDGMDCLPAVVRCPVKIREHCASRFANGICDPECNTNGCGFDGGDCDNETNATIITNIRITVQMDPKEFQVTGGQSLMEISSALRVTVRIQRDEEGPLVFQWNGESEMDRVKMNERQLTEQHVLSTSISRKIKRSATNIGVVVYLEVQENCDTGKCLYKDAQSVVDSISARLAKKGIDSFGIPISEALVAEPRKSGNNTGFLSWNALLLIGAGCLIVMVVLMLGALPGNRTRKRRMINASVWMPPMENEEKNRKNHQSITSSQHSLLEASYDGYIKRQRNELQHYSLYPNPQGYGNGNDFLGDFNHTNLQIPTEPEPESPIKLHTEAAGSYAITEPITRESVNIIDPRHNRTVLHWIASNSSAEKSEDLIVHEAKECIAAGADVNAMDCDENTPLMLAVLARRRRLVAYLMKAGADPTIYNKSERSALHQAAANRDFGMMVYMLNSTKLKGDIEELDRNGMTALMIVAHNEGRDQVASAKLLVEKGAKVDYDGAARKDSEKYKGRTALHYAAQVSNMPIVKYLVGEKGSNKDKQDEDGKTPIMLAAQEGRIEVVMYLIQQGASVEAVDATDHTARQLAQANNHHNIVDIFDRCRPEREYSMDLHIQHTHQPQPSRKVTRAPKKQTSRSKKESASNSRDSTHLTPPPSDGSTSTPSPQHFMNTTHTTPTSLNYLSPEYQTEAGSSEAFQPQCGAFGNGEMWYTRASTSYTQMQNEPMTRYSEPAHYF